MTRWSNRQHTGSAPHSAAAPHRNASHSRCTAQTGGLAHSWTRDREERGASSPRTRS
ncbi:hypothetical protein ACFL59_10090 [Planctomycetota bacterium]